jgi:hypothetical protein
MAILAESGGSGTGVNATKTAAQIAAEARLTSLNNSIAQINQTNAAANKLAAEPVTPTATTPASAATSAQFTSTLGTLSGTSSNIESLIAAAQTANAPVAPSAADTAQLAVDKTVAAKAEATATALNRAGGSAGTQPGSAWIWNGTAWVKPAMPQDGNTYTWDDNKGWVTSALNTAKTTTSQVDSIAAITALLSSYGIGELGPAITAAVMKGYSTDTIQLIMQDPNSNDPLAVAFQTRFPANKARLQAGKSVLSPGEYLAAERTYTQVMQSYGVANLATRDKLNQFITNDISATEVADRVSLAVNRVQNADAATKEALKQYYPMLNQADIVGAVLDPTEGLPALQRKITIGEIGGAALAQGLKDATGKINVAMGASALADLGVTKQQAQQGFQTVAELTPTGNFLSDISASGQKYGQLQAEQEAFQGLASAKRARQILTAEEQARFGGSSGAAKGAFSTGYLSKQSSAGLF